MNYVSIEESEKRRSNLIQQFKQYNITNFTPHIYKRYQEYDNVVLNGPYVKDLHENSKGPTTSHIKAIKSWYDSTNEDFALFCEDDISLEPVQYWSFTWDEFVNNLPKDWECIQLAWIRPNYPDISFRLRDTYDWGAAAYLMKREYAKKLIDHYYVSDNEFNLEIHNTDLIPIVENILFANLGVVYNIPLLVEDVKNVQSTYFGIDFTAVNGQGEYHWDSYNHIINWWKNTGVDLSIQQIMSTLKIKHIYQQSQFGENWFSYPNLYRSIVDQFPSGSTFVEVGSWKGKSSAFMAVEIANSKKNIKFYCIDTWEGSLEHQDNKELEQLYDIFINNMQPVQKYYKDLRMSSLEGANKFQDQSLDFVFIDASHEYEDVKKDIEAWLPKIKTGGILAGHDYYLGDVDYFPGVKQAVNECLSNIQTSEDCFIFRKI